ncbi:Hsp70 family protein [Oscillatoria sp. FACHB-1407]|uniref:Hsp70 family protein n=1 Tax=Oscillatoria sp. FACHB-1407 TaxID=2692847 RepID=UPI001687357C|nr:Hsp70 family protein [Oscillatoria sp. FACHB-1407]MBD2459920.1 Hsp70 family protein [Oscillatoria sp. FACHB-1407]
MGRTVGIDLGTTNSEVAIVENGQARVLPGEDGDLILPSCVGFSDTGKLLVGRDALRQYAAAPDRTVRSIKRWMGTDHQTTLQVGGTESNETRDFLPHEISAIILRALKQRAEAALGEDVTQAVITVPAYFTDAQRQATKTAGEIAGLEVLQIINEPTAAALAYNVRSEETERVLVYDLGGGTFDVSVVEITGEVTEVLASHGNNQLGGDDFDRRLQLHLAEQFRQMHGVAVPDDPVTQARLLRAAEHIKITLSAHAFAPVREAFLGSKGKTALHLETEIARTDFEKLIRPLLDETLEAIDRALRDAKLKPDDLDRIILVGGSTRIPLVQHMVEEHLGQAPVDGVQPDLCVALGAALQAGVLIGEEVEAILVDVIPHSLGISAAITTPMGIMPGFFSVIIPRNSVVPVSRSEVYSTLSPNQTVVEIEVFQGENEVAEENVPLGSYRVEGLPPGPPGSIQIEVHFDFDMNGILTVTTTEKGKGQQGTLVVNNAGVQRLSSHELKQARADLEALFDLHETGTTDTADAIAMPPELAALVDRAQEALETLDEEQANELQELLDQIEEALVEGETSTVSTLQEELSDFLYYVTNPQ